MRKWLKGCILFIVVGIIGLGWFVWNAQTDPMADWIYYCPTNTDNAYDENGKPIDERTLWRVHRKSGEKQLVWSDPLDASHFVMSEDAIFFWEYHERKHRLCQINADGSECRELYRGSDVPCRNLAYQDGWLYFFTIDQNNMISCMRLEVETSELEVVLPEASIDFARTRLITTEDYLYTITRQVEDREVKRRGIVSYDLDTGETYTCLDLNLGALGDMSDETVPYLDLAVCGEYLVLLCSTDNAIIQKIYATQKDECITEETVWEEVRFPDMKEPSMPPYSWEYTYNLGFYIMDYTNRYQFYDGYVFYLNENAELCSRPLLGDAEDVTVYEGTALGRDSRGSIVANPADLTFGKDCFYYRYASEVEDVKDDGVWQNPKVVQWSGHIGRLP